jgi:cell division protein ZapA
MKYKVKVNIDGRPYTLTAAENDGYIEHVAEYVTKQIKQMKGVAHASSVDAVTMAAMNIADSYFQERNSSENLRRQLKDALDEASSLKREISDLKRENFRLSQGK